MTPEDAIEILKETGYTDRELDFYEALDMAIEALKELPKRRKEAKRWKRKALQAEPVKHGEWENHGNEWLTCSLCDWESAFHYNFCPNCGAKMDKE